MIINESASEAIINKNTDNKYVLASQIALNIKGEHDAIEGYDKLLSIITDEEDIATIKEIISDELNHSELLTRMMAKYDGNIKPATDGLDEAYQYKGYKIIDQNTGTYGGFMIKDPKGNWVNNNTGFSTEKDAEEYIDTVLLDESLYHRDDERRNVRSLALACIQAHGENNSVGKYDLFIRDQINKWADSGHDADFIGAAIEKDYNKRFK